MSLKKLINIKGKHILITGANGFIGSKLSLKLLELGAKLITTDKFQNPTNLKKIQKKKGFSYYCCDLLSKESIKEFKHKVKSYKSPEIVYGI